VRKCAWVLTCMASQWSLYTWCIDTKVYRLSLCSTCMARPTVAPVTGAPVRSICWTTCVGATQTQTRRRLRRDADSDATQTQTRRRLRRDADS
jgi:hypothetical protein